MYINDVSIISYLIFAIWGGIIGQFLDYANSRLIAEKSVFSLDYFRRDKIQKKLNYKLIIVMAFIYIIILYFCKIQFDFVKDLKLIKFLILSPMLVSAFVIDYKMQIIPNRLNLSLFEVGLLFVFLYGLFVDLQIAKDMLIGSVTGAGIFLIITLIGGVLSRKRNNGFRRCKTNGSARVIFWLYKYNCSGSNFIFAWSCN